jgi:ATP-dependent DNA helicase Rep
LIEEDIRYNPIYRSDKNLKQNDVTLCTMHSSKGLEFEVVFILNYKKPALSRKVTYITERDKEDGLRKEKHLHYVAFSRARDRLVVSGPDVKRIKDIAS